jgi:hypothetical protein
MLVVLFAAAAQLAVVLLGLSGGAKDFDQRQFHIPTIARFAAEWPAPDVSDYPAAVTPAYHLAMAALVRAGGDGLLADKLWITRLLSGGFTLALLGLVSYWCLRRLPPAFALAAALPVALSQYVFVSLAFLMPEGAAWLTVAGVLLLALSHRLPRSATILVGGLLVLAAVSVRQSNLWLAGLVWLAAWLGPNPAHQSAHHSAHQSGDPRADTTWTTLFSGWPRRLPWALAALLATAPAVALVAWFADVWGGLVPPTFQTGRGLAEQLKGASEHTGGNPAFPAITLTVFAFCGVPLAPLLLNRGQRVVPALRAALPFLAVGSAAGLLAAVAAPTTYDRAAGRFGSLWHLARLGPAIADRSLTIAAAAALGGGIIGLCLARVPARARWILLAAFLGFVAANSANAKAWVRYIEPFALLWLAAAAGSAARPEPLAAPPKWALAPAAALALALAALTIARVAG